jgi:3-hydroxyacyl-CoA dehydrogenase
LARNQTDNTENLIKMSWTNPSTTDRTVTILGAGVLGRRIAAAWAAGGYSVVLRDPSKEQCAAASEYVKSNGWRFPGKHAGEELEVQTFQDLEPALEKSFLVIECVPEKLEIKHTTFAELERLAPKDAILVSNSSSYKSREVAQHLKPETRQRVLNMHYSTYIAANLCQFLMLTIHSDATAEQDRGANDLR